MADEKNLNEEEEMTVTLTLDDDSEIECVVLNIFSRQKTELLFWITSWMMMSTRSLLTHLTKC